MKQRCHENSPNTKHGKEYISMLPTSNSTYINLWIKYKRKETQENKHTLFSTCILVRKRLLHMDTMHTNCEP